MPVDRGGRRIVLQEAAELGLLFEEGSDPTAQFLVAGAGLVEKGRPLVRVVLLHGLQENRFCLLRVNVHGTLSTSHGYVREPR